MLALSPSGAGPAHASGEHTTRRNGERVVTAVWRTFGDADASCEVVTFVRERLVDVQEQLEREARFALALRSLDVGEGETTRDGRPIGELTAVRAARLPPPVAATLTVDGAAREALGFAFGMHAATWSDLDDLGVAAIVYTRGWSEPLVLVTD